MVAVPLDGAVVTLNGLGARPSGSVTARVPEMALSSPPLPLVPPDATLGPSSTTESLSSMVAVPMKDLSFVVSVGLVKVPVACPMPIEKRRALEEELPVTPSRSPKLSIGSRKFTMAEAVLSKVMPLRLSVRPSKRV